MKTNKYDQLKERTMPTLKARQHTADHILSTILENKYKAKSKAMQFGSEFVRMVWECKTDLREKKDEFEKYVNEEIGKGREVKCYALPYTEAAKIADLSLIPKSVSKPTIYEIVGLNKIACAGPHVSNTKEIGAFKILELKRKGMDTYEIKYQVNDEMEPNKPS